VNTDGSGAYGRYQLRRAILIDAGWLENVKGEKWTAKARQNGITSYNDLLKNPPAQEAAMTDAMKEYERKAVKLGLLARVGQTIQGLKGPFQVTEAGIIAASHRGGSSGVANYFRRLDATGGDSRAATLGDRDIEIETRLRTFATVPYQRFNP